MKHWPLLVVWPWIAFAKLPPCVKLADAGLMAKVKQVAHSGAGERLRPGTGYDVGVCVFGKGWISEGGWQEKCHNPYEGTPLEQQDCP